MRRLILAVPILASLAAAPMTHNNGMEIVQIPIRSIIEVGLVDSEHLTDRDFWQVDLVTNTAENEPTSVVARVYVTEALFTSNDPAALERFAASVAAAAVAVRESQQE